MFHLLLRKRLIELGCEPDRLPSQFRALLSKSGVNVSIQCSINWLDGSRRPSRGNLAGVLDVLGLFGPERDAATAAWAMAADLLARSAP